MGVGRCRAFFPLSSLFSSLKPQFWRSKKIAHFCDPPSNKPCFVREIPGHSRRSHTSGGWCWWFTVTGGGVFGGVSGWLLWLWLVVVVVVVVGGSGWWLVVVLVIGGHVGLWTKLWLMECWLVVVGGCNRAKNKRGACTF